MTALKPDDILNKYFPVLDKGFVSLVDIMGNDVAIEQAARVSYGTGTRKTSDTNNLIRYLMRSGHTSPFEQVEFKFCVKVPMDCWRQWIRHRAASVNEYSTRYSEAINECQQTTDWRLQSTNNKQGSMNETYSINNIEWPKDFDKTVRKSAMDTFIFSKSPSDYLTKREQQLQTLAREIYEERLSFGIAREQARKDLPLSNYTIAYWKIDLHNLFHFLRLRCDNHAQKEIRDYANVIASMVKIACPIAFQAWIDYQFCASSLSRLDIVTLEAERAGCKDVESYAKSCGMSDREFRELHLKIMEPMIPEFELNLDNARDPSYFEEKS